TGAKRTIYPTSAEDAPCEPPQSMSPTQRASARGQKPRFLPSAKPKSGPRPLKAPQATSPHATYWCTRAKTTLFALRQTEVRPTSAESAAGDFQPIKKKRPPLLTRSVSSMSDHSSSQQVHNPSQEGKSHAPLSTSDVREFPRCRHDGPPSQCAGGARIRRSPETGAEPARVPEDESEPSR